MADRNEKERENESIGKDAADKRESGEPAGGAGRRDDVGHSGVYPISGDERPPHGAEIRTEAGWGQGDRGAAGYEDSGSSELDGELLKRMSEEKKN